MSTALDLLVAAYTDLGVIGLTDLTLPPALAQKGLVTLNHLVAGWRTQFGTVTSIDRTVFDLIDNQQTYTIGPGGDFNVARPLSIEGAGLWLNGLNGPQTVTSIIRSGLTATVTQTAHGFAVGDEAFIKGADDPLYNGLQTVETVSTANTYTYTLDGRPPTPAIGTLTAQSVQGQPIEIPRVVITDDAYQSIQIKNLPNSQFTVVYYNPTYPLGSIFLWPRPTTDQNQLVLYLQNAFTGFADLSTDYAFPELPGYALALQYNVAQLLALPGAVSDQTVLSRIDGLAAQWLGHIKRANNKLTDLPTDASMLAYDRRQGYNISSGTGGGGVN